MEIVCYIHFVNSYATQKLLGNVVNVVVLQNVASLLIKYNQVQHYKGLI